MAKLLKKSDAQVLLSSGKMAIATLMSRILGLVRDQIMAWLFGASSLTDAFLVAYRIPNLLRDLFAEGAFSAAFVPTFTELKQEDPAKANDLLWSLLVVLTVVTGLASLFFICFAPFVVGLMAPSFVADPEKFALTVVMTRIMSPFLWCVSIAALFMGALNSLKMFFIPSLAPCAYNISSILFMLFVPWLFESYGWPGILALACGTLVGGFFQALVQIPSLIKKGFGPVFPTMFWSRQTRKILNKMSIGLVGFAAVQVNIFVATILATGAGVGAVSWLNYAFRIFMLPIGILSVSLSGANLVHFSEAWSKKNFVKAHDSLRTSYDWSFLLLVPTAVILYELSPAVINLLFERGRFSATDTFMSAQALRLYLIGLPFYGVYKIVAPTFFAMDRQKIPVTCSVIAVSINVIFCLIFAPIYGFKILAFGTTLSIAINVLLQSFFLHRHLKVGLSFFINSRILKILLASAATYFITHQINLWGVDFGVTLLHKTGLIAFVSLAGLSVFVLAMVLLGERKLLTQLK